VVVDVGLPDFCGTKLAWHIEDAAVHQGRVALPGPRIGICAFVVGNPGGDGTLISVAAISELLWREKWARRRLTGRLPEN